MKQISINRAAIWGCLIGAVCMAIFLVYNERYRGVPMIGYAVEIFAGAMFGAGLFSLMAWIANMVTRGRR